MLASLEKRIIWNELLDMYWDDPVNGRNTALYHMSGPVPEHWLDQPSKYFYCCKVAGYGPTLKVVNDAEDDKRLVLRARAAQRLK